MKLRLKSCPRCSGDMAYDPYDEVWYCINCSRREYKIEEDITWKEMG